ncbi:response regulator [Lusitaniella coriacea LEGE 07157]|uniref:Response regulator n=1 Tax=Lusitaniella coriacea LEGE 07157 TaxID=945747 RepID=A0A8J7JEZ6_9CYAN|nr:response regulator [Lusitaniella coriacea]MBE9119020.1 response regulator [Lusitaniella coriacea LEGE 07157]
MASEKILVVDDQKNIRLTIAQALDPLGYEVRTAVNGEEALRYLEAENYDLILTDLQMPGIGGLELLERAVKLYPDIQFLVISAHGTVDNAVEAMKLGAVDFIQKPFTPRELRDAIARVLSRRNSETEQESNYESTLDIAKHNASKREFQRAIESVKQAVALDPSRPEAFNFLGELQEVLGEQSEALKNYRVALDLDPTYQLAQENLSRATRSPSSRPSL